LSWFWAGQSLNGLCNKDKRSSLLRRLEKKVKYDCRQLDPNTINVEDETLRVKVMVAIHAARAYEVGQFML
jgi:hypothetical protein